MLMKILEIDSDEWINKLKCYTNRNCLYKKSRRKGKLIPKNFIKHYRKNRAQINSLLKFLNKADNKSETKKLKIV